MHKISFLLLFLAVIFVTSNGSIAEHQSSDQLSEAKISLQNVYENALQEFNLTSRMKYHNVPGVSFAVVKNGKLDWAKGYGVIQKGSLEKVDTQTMFSVGSVSKVGTAVLVLRLCEQGLLNIDANVNQYLKSWKVPENKFTKDEPVTLRRIMSHTAGLTVSGFADFLPGERLPTTIQILKGVWPAKNNQVYVNIPVGSKYRYSGGGTTIEQLLIEDLTQKVFHEAANELLFQPVRMNRSSYENPLPASFGNIAKAHNRNGNPVALPRGYQSMPETAASGLWTTPGDFSKVMLMLMNAFNGKEDSYLSQAIVKDMMNPVFPGNYGLGPKIKKEGSNISFSHGGANDSYRAHFIGYLKNQNGVVIFTNGTNGSELIDELLVVFNALLE